MRLLAEFVGLFILIPTLPVIGLLPVSIIPVLVVAAILVLAVLFHDPRFDRRSLGLGPPTADQPRARTAVRRIAACFAVSALGIGAAVALLDSDSLFYLLLNRPERWALIMVAYPILSVYPQEVIFRAFFFHRYGPAFQHRWASVTASALAFGYAHIVLGNAIAIALSLAGGFIFAYTYDRTRSTLLCALEHGLYGCFIFTIGLGNYFHYGSLRLAETATAMGH